MPRAPESLWFETSSGLLVPVRRLGETNNISKRMKINWGRRFLFFLASAFVLQGFAYADAARLNGARVTYVANDVRSGAAQEQRVSMGDILSAGTAINNRAEARSELTFGNGTVARLGANTVLDLKAQPAGMNLREGGMLFQIPKRSKAEITTASLVVTSKRATGLLERNGDSYIKLLLLEGEARVALRHRIGESIILKPGQILITGPKASSLPEAAYFDIARAVKTCRLISDFPPLGNQDAIARAAGQQMRLTSRGNYIPSNLVIFGRGTLVNLLPPQPPDNVVPKHNSKPQPAN
jgi:FecR-like protein